MDEWGDDNLSKFLEMVHSNQKANRINFAGPYATMRRIDDCLVKAGKNLIGPKPMMAGVLLLRAQYAYKTAVGMALAGQVVEAFVMMRSVLEYAGYALIIFDQPTLEDVFILRHKGETELKAHKKAFTSGAIRDVLARYDQKLAELFDIFYQRTIDFGGHPNPHATFSAAQIDGRDGQTGFTALAITKDQIVLAHAMKSAAQVGLTALHILQHVFKPKFEILGIRAEIDALRLDAGL